MTPHISPVGGPGAPKIFLVVWPEGGLLKFRTWCTPGDGEGKGNFSNKFYQNVRAKTVTLLAQKLRPIGNFGLHHYVAVWGSYPGRGVRFRYSPQGRGAATPNLTNFYNVFSTTVWRRVAAKPEVIVNTFIPRTVGV